MDKQSLNILIIDDNAVDRALIKEMLLEYSTNHTVFESENGMIGKNIISQNKIDCVLVDFSMPDMTGIDFTKEIHTDEQTNSIPIVLITGKGNEEIAVKAMKSGASDYVTKGNLQSGMLGKTVENAISKKQMEKQIKESENRYKRLVELSPDLMALHNKEKIVYINSVGAHILGLTISEALSGVSILDFIIKDHKKKTRKVFKQMLNLDEVSSIEHITLVQHDDVIDMEMVFAPVFYLGKPVIQIVGRDITRLVDAQNELKKLSDKDALTNIPNRRSFFSQLDNQWRVAIRNKQPISIIMIDIDFFKLYNDNYGHQTGDACLRHVAQALHNSIRRPTDIAARYGGEEFIIMLPNTLQCGAINITKGIQEKIQSLQIEHKKSKVASIITLSIGISTTVPDKGDAPEILIDQADQALYNAKKNGRNRYCIFGSD